MNVSKEEHVRRLLDRLEAIGASLQASGRALALIGLGSAGLEQERLDQYSDLDFFVIVEPGAKASYLDDLGWLKAVHPVAYCFRNTVDGYKLLFSDGIFCEFAIFEPDEIESVPFTAGKIIWKQPQVPGEIANPRNTPAAGTVGSIEWLLGEALTNLYVGLARFKRGEKLSAARFIQQYAVDRLLELAATIESVQPGTTDPFSPERRVEQGMPGLAGKLADFVPGYDHSPQAAGAILAYLEANFQVDPAISGAIRSYL